MKQKLGISLQKKSTKFINSDGMMKNLFNEQESKQNENSILQLHDVEDYLQQVELENREFMTRRTMLRLGIDDVEPKQSSTLIVINT